MLFACNSSLLSTVVLILAFQHINPACALKFMLVGSRKDCINKEIPNGVETVSGGVQMTALRAGSTARVKVEVLAPDGMTVWSHTVTHEAEFVFRPKTYGVYSICFTNELYTVNAELVYLDFDRGLHAADMTIQKPSGLGDERTEAASQLDTVQVHRVLIQLANRLDVLVGEQRMIKHRYEWQLNHAIVVGWEEMRYVSQCSACVQRIPVGCSVCSLCGENRRADHSILQRLQKLMRSRTLLCTLAEVGVLVLVASLQVLVIRAMFSDPSRGRGRSTRVVKGLLHNGPGLPMARMGRMDRLS